MRSTAWYPRLGDIPGITYVTPPGIDRSSLPRHDARPKVERFKDLDGNTIESLWWDEPGGGGTSQSPASSRADRGRTDLSGPKALERLREVFELPGEPSDYHFAILHALDLIWSDSDRNPQGLTSIEELVRLDIDLCRAAPDAASRIEDGTRGWYQIPGIGRLVRMYEREGAWHEALELAQLAATEFDQLHDEVEKLTERVAALEAEGT